MNKSMRTLFVALSITGLAAGILSGCGSSTANNAEPKGKVYYLNFKTDTQDDWELLGEQYTKETGVPVSVQTAASGTYDSTLKSEFSKSEPPTLFQINGPVGQSVWKDYTADLTDTELYKQLKNPDLALKSPDGSKVVAVPYAMETYGLIYNKDIMNKYTSLPDAKVSSADDIDSFDTLKAVADDMQSRKDQLGIKGAFTSTGFDSSSDWRFKTHLMNMALYYEFSDDGIKEQPATVKGTYLPEFKQIFDLYLDDSTAARTEVSAKTLNDSNAEFAMGEAVFYQNGTWIWADLKDEGMTPEQLGMIPIYIGAPGENNQGLSTGTENYWAINSQAPQEDQKATADFLKWVLTTETGKKALSIDMAFTTPFKSLSDMESDNPLIQIAVKDSDSGRTPVSWDFTMAPSETWKNNLGNAMLEYAQGTGDWDGVQTAFVDGWAKEYAIAHSND